MSRVSKVYCLTVETDIKGKVLTPIGIVLGVQTSAGYEILLDEHVDPKNGMGLGMKVLLEFKKLWNQIDPWENVVLVNDFQWTVAALSKWTSLQTIQLKQFLDLQTIARFANDVMEESSWGKPMVVSHLDGSPSVAWKETVAVFFPDELDECQKVPAKKNEMFLRIYRKHVTGFSKVFNKGRG